MHDAGQYLRRSRQLRGGLLTVLVLVSGCATSVETLDIAGPDRPRLEDTRSVDDNPVALARRADAEPIGAPEAGQAVDAAMLRSDLQVAFTAHSELVTLHARQIIDGVPAGASAALLSERTSELAQAIEAVSDPVAGRAFEMLWTGHVELLSWYTSAQRSKDGEGVVDAVQGLRLYEADFSRFLSALTEGNVAHDDVHAAIRTHIAAVLEHSDAWAAGNYDEAFARAADAHLHIDSVAAMLANGMATAQPTTFVGTVFDDVSADCAAHQLDQAMAVSARFDLARAESSSRQSERIAAGNAFQLRAQSASSTTLAVLDDRRTSMSTATPDGLLELHREIRQMLFERSPRSEQCARQFTRSAPTR